MTFSASLNGHGEMKTLKTCRFLKKDVKFVIQSERNNNQVTVIKLYFDGWGPHGHGRVAI